MAFNINGFMLVLQKDVGASLESSEAVHLQILYLDSRTPPTNGLPLILVNIVLYNCVFKCKSCHDTKSVYERRVIMSCHSNLYIIS